MPVTIDIQLKVTDESPPTLEGHSLMEGACSAAAVGRLIGAANQRVAMLMENYLDAVATLPPPQQIKEIQAFTVGYVEGKAAAAQPSEAFSRIQFKE